LLGNADFAWLDELRQKYFPPERNVLRAHLTMFHHIAPSLEDELCRRLRAAAHQPVPDARVTGLINLGQGVAYAIESPALAAIRESLAEAFWDTLMPQDRAPWRPHVTIQNKVKPHKARSLLDAQRASFRPKSLEIAGLAVFRYLGGPWGPVGAWRFGNGHAMKPPLPLPS
jgi:2'-5' RNA ligase